MEEIKEKKKKVSEKDKKMEELLNQVKELEEKNLRISAEMINTIRRKDEETTRIIKYASTDIIMELLSICDNFERALSVKTDESNEELNKYKQGMKMIYENFLNVLKLNEVKEIEALGKEFDANLHNAVMTDHVDGKKVNEIIEVLQKGYIYKDKVIRPAMVKVNM